MPLVKWNDNRSMLRLHQAQLLIYIAGIEHFERIEIPVGDHLSFLIGEQHGDGGVVADHDRKKIKIGIYIGVVAQLTGRFGPQFHLLPFFFRKTFNKAVGIPKGC